MHEEADFYNYREANSIRFCKEWQSKYWKSHNGSCDSRSSSESGSQNIRLHLSESHLEKGKGNISYKKQTEVILISDSSDDEIISTQQRSEHLVSVKSLLVADSSCDESEARYRIPEVRRIAIINESDEDQVSVVSSVKPNVVSKPAALPDSEDDEIPATQNLRLSQSIRKVEIPIEMTDDIQTLSERKKRQIANWLEAYVPQSQCESSCSESVISASCNNSTSSGNSSLERFEQHHETPNNRGRILKPATEITPRNEIYKNKEIPKQLENVVSKKIVAETPINRSVVNESPGDSGNKSTRRQLTLENYLQKSKVNGSIELGSLKKKSLQNQTVRETVKKPPLKDIEIKDCADILDKLYGNKWRAVANDLLPISETKAKPVPKVSRAIQTEKKSSKINQVFKEKKTIKSSESESSKRVDVLKTRSTVAPKESKAKSKAPKPSSSESSPDGSFYTAQTHVPCSQVSVPAKIPETVRRALAICDPESDDEESVRPERIERRRLSYSDDSDTDTSEFDPYDLVIPKKTVITKSKKPSTPQPKSRSFLASLSNTVPIAVAHPDAKTYRTKYKTTKEELCKRLYKLFNENVFESKLPEDMSIEWNARMRGTAGFCYNKSSIKALGAKVRASRIVLSTKILDTPDRLRDTLVHEMCHAATWLVNGVTDGHGSYWKAWAQKALKAFPELPPITRCHDYEIKTKFTYRCVDCGYSIGRHSKSLDVERKRCGHCFGKFELLVNKTTKNGTVQTKTPAKEPSGFALFVKENYHSVKQNQSKLKHGEVMKILGQKFSAVKITKNTVGTGNKENDAPNP